MSTIKIVLFAFVVTCFIVYFFGCSSGPQEVEEDFYEEDFDYAGLQNQVGFTFERFANLKVEMLLQNLVENTYENFYIANAVNDSTKLPSFGLGSAKITTLGRDLGGGRVPAQQYDGIWTEILLTVTQPHLINTDDPEADTTDFVNAVHHILHAIDSRPSINYWKEPARLLLRGIDTTKVDEWPHSPQPIQTKYTVFTSYEREGFILKFKMTTKNKPSNQANFQIVN